MLFAEFQATTILTQGSVDFRGLAEQGMTLLGLTRSFDDGELTFAPDLADNLARGDANYLSVLDEADAYIASNGLDLPEEADARTIRPDPACVTDPILVLNLAEAGITSINWATGFAVDYSWLKVAVFDEAVRPLHKRGVTTEPGIYFLCLPIFTSICFFTFDCFVALF